MMYRFVGIEGDTFIGGEPSIPIHHLYILSTNEDPSGNVLIVNITSDSSDTTVRLDKGDHPFIYKQCYVAYKYARIRPLANIQRAIEAGNIQVHDPLDADILEKIQNGFLHSPFVAANIKEL